MGTCVMADPVVYCAGVCSPVVSVCVCWRFLYTLVHLIDQQTVVCMNRMTEVLTVLLLL